MASNGIRDQVAIIGMGCTAFGERWESSADDLLLDAVQECLESVPGLGRDDVDAYWLGTVGSGQSGLALSRPAAIDYRPVTRVENFCATGSEAFRGACYAVAAGAYDIAMAVGVEKLKDSGFSGLTRASIDGDGTAAELTQTTPAAFAALDPAYCARYGVGPEAMRDAMTHVAYKNHANGALNSRAQYRSVVAKETIDRGAGSVAGRLGVLDCSGVSDGAAAALVVRAAVARRYTDRPLYVKALSLIAGPGSGAIDLAYDYTTFPEVVRCAQDAYRQAGIDRPAQQLSLAEVHDCFTPTELVLMEDLGFSERGHAWSDELGGAFDRDGRLPVNVDGGLKSFGHPVGASGLRMLFECWLQLRGDAGERQLASPRLGLTHNLGGRPGSCVSFISIVGNAPR
jgi:acetyl-CoA C-acetyltransferase